ncbi:hypothetical protein [Nocardioides nitrophenolicus]|uniref:hypothetical protein n=1 Tax=Nocardioides nitrophenolicus TaxID=60489 RepID=UPI001959B7EB|nr:hypothetical protein [Nocardioides nitrophenolicus]MBM7518892.1 hypothetical protein [Nocardioides nitrophenolicus]
MRRSLLPAVVLCLAALAACGPDGAPPPREAATTADPWAHLPDLPLAERDGPVVVWTGAEVLAIGGDIGEACPPSADCARPNEAAADGAALDPATRAWRPIADAPRPVPAYSPRALVGAELFVVVDRAVLVYDLAADRWTTLPRRIDSWYQPVADGDRLVLLSGSDENGARPDLVWTPATKTWSELPDDPLGPSFDRSAVSTPRGLVLGAHELVADPGAGANPSYVEAALLDRATGGWRTFGPSGQLGAPWAVVGDRLIGLSLDSSDGGGDPPGDYGRPVPFGGRLDLATGAWSPLPDPPPPPAAGTGSWPVFALDGGPLVAGSGYLYDDATARWREVPRPAHGPARPGPAVWAGDTLVVVTGQDDGRDWPGVRTNEVWSWTPAAP